MSSRWAWLFDIGSTFTKLSVVDLEDVGHRFRAQSPTTVATNVRHGFLDAVHQIEQSGGPAFDDAAFRAASSSAAGGLALVVSGLVPRLSAEAGRIAALGAGAKLVGSMSYRLTSDDIDTLQRWKPDIVLLTGGTDGGERETLLLNASALAGWSQCPTVIVAGNREVSGEAAALLSVAGISAVVVPNILPELDRLVIEPVRDAIREEFLTNIVKAKGIDAVRRHLDADILPTPGVVLDGVRFLAEHFFRGGVMVVEVGGATTNVHSWSSAHVGEGVVHRGLQEPELKRTVEGDLGVRWNAETILALAGEQWFADHGVEHAHVLAEYVSRVTADPSTLPQNEIERGFDSLLATFAAQTAIARHCGRQKQVMLPEGPVLVQEGKDLRRLDVVLGTGGSVISAESPASILEAALETVDPFLLTPSDPAVSVDAEYMLYAIGLLSEHDPDATLELAQQSLALSAGHLSR
jgi:uncharacterized protein (TIGR01319 family)